MSSTSGLQLLAAASVIFLLGVSPLALGVSGQVATATTTATPIKHVIIVMLENHSFDNFFGAYPSGSESSTANPLGLTVPKNLNELNGTPALLQLPMYNYSTPDPVEGYDTYHNDWDNGKMDGFRSNSGPQSMTYFTSAQLALEWDWAEEYGLGDMYFSSYLSETAPNRLMSLAGETPVKADYGPPPSIPVNESIFYELSQAQISWSYFIQDVAGNDYPLNFFDGFDSYSQHVQSWDQFYSDLASNSLPEVSWMSPLGGGAYGVDQHPSYNVTAGEVWLLHVVDAVMNSPAWNSTAIFVTYDEGGGYYDHVPPPSLDGIQLGFRVPLIVISPFAKENYVSNTVLNHGSLLAFIDYNWRLAPLNGFVADSNIPIDFFDFNSSARAPIVLNESSQFPIAPQTPFSNLTYHRTGSSSLTLAQAGGGSTTSGTTPQLTQFLDSNLAYVFVVILVIAGFFLSTLRRTRKRR